MNTDMRIIADNKVTLSSSSEYLEFRAGFILQANASVDDPDELMHHRLIRPLRKKGCYWVVPPV